MLRENSAMFEEDLVEVFPKKSQPKIFLREFVDDSRRDSSLIREEKINYRMYLGYLIPKHDWVNGLNVDSLKALIGFKQGLMLLHQFVDFMQRIHQKNLRFGHLDFENLYFLRNAQKRFGSSERVSNRHAMLGLSRQHTSREGNRNKVQRHKSVR